MKMVNQAVPKVDSQALVTGKPVYTDDIAPKDCLIVKVLRSPYAHALIKNINTEIAMKVPGIECVLTYKDCPNKRFTMAGQTYPEPSPYDRLILDQRVRFVGDAVAIVAGETEAAVNKAMKMIKVEYEVLEPFWISEKRRTMKSWYIRRITGKVFVRQEQIIRETYVLTGKKEKAILKKHLKNVTISQKRRIIQKRISRR